MAFQYYGGLSGSPATQRVDYTIQQPQQQEEEQQMGFGEIMEMMDKFKGGDAGSSTGTSGNMGMGSDAASLANAESLAGFGSSGSGLGASGSMGMGSDAASLAFAESGMGLGGSGSTAGGSAAGSSGGLGAAGIGGIIVAAIAVQHMATEDTDTEVEGVKTGNVFSGQFGTEPWMGWVHDKLGLSPTAGEKFDAAVKNKDWDTAFKRSFEMSDYWADPVSSHIETAAAGLGMNEEAAGWMFNPIGEGLSKIFG